ncbi:MAG: ComF family protein [Chlorobi bacterium]|nr:ComF family protein [Chlorobiota bacterium]
MRLRDDLLHILAPALCPGCDQLLMPTEHGYCRSCRASLSPAPFPRDLFTELLHHFSDDHLAISALGALYLFEQDSPVQHLIHALKYHGCYDVGIELGKELGATIKMFPEFDGVDAIIPVPLHRARRRERGYNQAEAIAEGVADAFSVEILADRLYRSRHTISQTTLNAKERQRNVQNAFAAHDHSLVGRTILLCDDVCTTGATLNICADRLLSAGAKRVVAAAVAKDLVQNPNAVQQQISQPFFP